MTLQPSCPRLPLVVYSPDSRAPQWLATTRRSSLLRTAGRSARRSTGMRHRVPVSFLHAERVRVRLRPGWTRRARADVFGDSVVMDHIHLVGRRNGRDHGSQLALGHQTLTARFSMERTAIPCSRRKPSGTDVSNAQPPPEVLGRRLRIHEAHLCGLSAGTLYYKVGGPGHWSGVYDFSLHLHGARLSHGRSQPPETHATTRTTSGR